MGVDVRLRAARDSDRELLFQWFNDPAAIQMAAFTRPALAERAAFDEHDRRIRSDPRIRHRAIEVDGVLVGTIASFPVDDAIEVTYWIDPAAWSRGVATAALRRFISDEDTRRPLSARVAEGNVGSTRVLEAVGFREKGHESSYAAGIGRTTVEHAYVLD